MFKWPKLKNSFELRADFIMFPREVNYNKNEKLGQVSSCGNKTMKLTFIARIQHFPAL